MGEWVSMDELGGTGVHCPQRRLRPGRRRRGGRDRLGAGDRSGICPRGSGRPPSRPIPTGPDRATPRPSSPVRRGASTTSARWPGGSSMVARCWSSRRRWAREHEHCSFARLEGPSRRRGRQPAEAARRRDRRRRGREGGGLRRLVRPLRPAAGRPRRHPGVHARHEAGGRRGDPARRLAAAGVRRCPGAEGDGDPPQGLRRRGDHDELEGPRSGLRLRLARRGDRNHGRRAGRRRRPPAAPGRGRGRGSGAP